MNHSHRRVSTGPIFNRGLGYHGAFTRVDAATPNTRVEGSVGWAIKHQLTVARPALNFKTQPVGGAK